MVSAGNHSGNSRGDDIDNVDIGMSLFDFAKLSMPGRDKKIVEYLDNNCRNLRLLSPAESVNALTVGATFEDTTGEAIRCHEALLEIFHLAEETTVPDEHIALLIKAMLIHGAKWGEIGQKFCNTLGWNSRNQYHDRLHRFIGYGKPDIDRAIECAKNRVTLIGYGNLNIGDAHLFRLPLPFNFNTREIRRRLTATLTYFSPIVPSRQKYRAVDMWFALENGKENLLDDRVDASDKAVTRGSVQHEIFENEQIVVWDENDDICIKVNCRGYAAKKLEEKIPYAIMVSFELKSKTDIDVYTMVAEKVKSRVLAV